MFSKNNRDNPKSGSEALKSATESVVKRVDLDQMKEQVNKKAIELEALSIMHTSQPKPVKPK